MATSTASRRLPNEDSTTRARPVPLARLHVLRLGYLVIAVGILLAKWPLLLHHPQPWPLYEGVETSMLVALSLLGFLGLRYPLQLLPALLFEVAWKLIWKLIPLAVIPWRYVVSQYVTRPADPWRSHAARTGGGQHS